MRYSRMIYEESSATEDKKSWKSSPSPLDNHSGTMEDLANAWDHSGLGKCIGKKMTCLLTYGFGRHLVRVWGGK